VYLFLTFLIIVVTAHMIRIFSFIFTLVVLVIFTSCNKTKDGFTVAESGLYYKLIGPGTGLKPSIGDIMEMEILYLTDKDSVLFDSKSKSDSFTVVLVEPTFKGGVEEGFAMMHAGDSALFKSSADSIFEKTFHTTLPPYLKPGSLITFKVKLKNFTPKSVFDSLSRARDIELRQQEFMKIESFLEKNKMDVMPTENGAYMVSSKTGTGDFPVKGDTVLVNYTGRTLDGTIFDRSMENKPFQFVLGTNMVIQGWEECIPLLNKGSVARMVIPSDLGYGGKEYGTLPAYATLVFDVEIVDIAQGKSIQ